MLSLKVNERRLKMDQDDCPWMQDVRKKLIEIFQDDVEALTRVLFYLDEEDRTYNQEGVRRIPPAWKTLKATLCCGAAFKTYAERLAEDTKRAEKDAAFRETMHLIYEQMMHASEELLPDDTFQDFDVARLTDFNVAEVSGFMGLARAWGLIPRSSQSQILELIPKIVGNKQVLLSLDEIVGLVDRVGGNIVMYGLAAVYLSYDAIKNIRRWWKGEISGERCCKNIVDSICTMGAGIGGGVAGAAMGAFAGPIGIVVGGIVGGIASSLATNLLIDRFTQFVFGIPKEEALENAYNFFGVKMNASNNEINASFRRLCLEHHPDKGGRSEDFFLVQIHMTVIKMSRGDPQNATRVLANPGVPRAIEWLDD